MRRAPVCVHVDYGLFKQMVDSAQMFRYLQHWNAANSVQDTFCKFSMIIPCSRSRRWWLGGFDQILSIICHSTWFFFRIVHQQAFLGLSYLIGTSV